MVSEEYSQLNKLFDELFPIHRSLSGPGIEKSLEIIARHMPLEIFGTPSGSRVFDWITPPAWHCRSATLTGPDGKTICDLSNSNLHVVNYSEPVDCMLTLAELQAHLHSLAHLPQAVPYVTSYYNRTWGFCLSQDQRDLLADGIYHAKIDADFRQGRIPLAHTILEGSSKREIVLSSYLCHPSLANNELSGPLVLLGLYNRLSAWPTRKHTFRFVLNPETIGSLCYLQTHGDHLAKYMDAGFVLTCLGGPASLSYKSSRRGNTKSDRLAKHWVERGEAINLRGFSPAGGSDERQYCSPGFNFPMGQFARTVYGQYEGYHNSFDCKEFMTIEALIDSINGIELFLKELDQVGPWINQAPYGEPQLGCRGLYPTLNSANTWTHSSDEVFDGRVTLERIMFVLNYSDGNCDLIDIAEKCECSVHELLPIVQRLEAAELLELKRAFQ